jgi:ribonuclease inhibitor
LKIDLKDIQSISQLHKTFKDKLGFPEWYGMNWDAFWDAITGLIEFKADLQLMNFAEFERRFPKDGKILSELAADYNYKELPFKIQL